MSGFVKALQEGLGSIRDVLLDGSQLTYSRIYRLSDRPQRQLQAKNVFLSTFPRFALEALGMVTIAFLGGFLVLQRKNSESVIPLLGALALGAQRLLPALQQIYSGWAILKGQTASMSSLLEMLDQPLPLDICVKEPLDFRHSILLKNAHFSYSSDQPEVLQGIDIEIHRGEKIGFIGTTGNGKSTVVDILMGLLPPVDGKLIVDGMDLYDSESPERLLVAVGNCSCSSEYLFVR